MKILCVLVPLLVADVCFGYSANTGYAELGRAMSGATSSHNTNDSACKNAKPACPTRYFKQSVLQDASDNEFLYTTKQAYDHVVKNLKKTSCVDVKYNSVYECDDEYCDRNKVVTMKSGHVFKGTVIGTQKIYMCDTSGQDRWLPVDSKISKCPDGKYKELKNNGVKEIVKYTNDGKTYLVWQEDYSKDSVSACIESESGNKIDALQTKNDVKKENKSVDADKSIYKETQDKTDKNQNDKKGKISSDVVNVSDDENKDGAPSDMSADKEQEKIGKDDVKSDKKILDSSEQTEVDVSEEQSNDANREQDANTDDIADDMQTDEMETLNNEDVSRKKSDVDTDKDVENKDYFNQAKSELEEINKALDEVMGRLQDKISEK